MRISLIIPTLNEEENLAATLEHACKQQKPFEEILVADGGSQDETQTIAEKYGVQFLKTPARGRSIQMNFGAKHAQADVLFFLHADTHLPRNASIAIQEALASSEVVGGGFIKKFDHNHLLLNGEKNKCRARHLVLKSIAGDQGLFVRKPIFNEVQGYPEVRVMEEYMLCKKLRQKGKLVLRPETVTTSARRFLEKGVLRCYTRMAIVATAYYLGFPSSFLEKVYYAR